MIEDLPSPTADFWEWQKRDHHIQRFYMNPELINAPTQPEVVINQGRVINVQEEIRRMEQTGPVLEAPK